MQEDVYQLENGVLTIYDRALSLKIKEPYIAKEVPLEQLREAFTAKKTEGALNSAEFATGDWSFAIRYHSQNYPLEVNLLRKGELEGQSVQLYPNGALESSSYYLFDSAKSSLLHGPSIHYYPDGTMAACTFWLFGKRQGKARYFTPQGQLSALLSWKEGKLEGRQEYYYSHLNHSSQKISLKSELNYRDGQLDGSSTLYFPDGTVKRIVHYKQGKRTEREQEWDNMGRPVIERFYQGSLLQSERYWFQGRLIEEREFADPQKDKDPSFARYWDIKGKLYLECKKQGAAYLFTQWNDQGVVEEEYEGIFAEGRPCRINRFAEEKA